MPRQPKLRRPGRGERMGLAFRVLWLLLYLPLAGLVKTRYRNIEGIPQQGPAILVVNHVSHIDPFLVAKFVLDAGRTPRFLAKESLFDVRVVGSFMRGAGAIPVRRGSVEARQALEAAAQALRAGGLIVLHPEGTVTRDPEGWPMIGRTGAARLATLAPDVPVIPIAQWGVQQHFDLYKKTVRIIPRARHEILVGEPVDLSPFRDRAADPAVLHDITDRIMRSLRDEVAVLRGVPAPSGDLYHWVRPGDTSEPGDAA